MSDMLDIREKLEDTGEMIARLERHLAAHPDDRSVLLNLKSLEKRRHQLEAEFAGASEEMGTDVCRYRFLLDGESAKIAGVASNLVNYQLLVSVLYDALTTGPKQTLKLGADIQAKTALDFGYTFAGSVGFVFTIPNQRLIGLETDLDLVFRRISELVKIGTSDDIREYSRKIGRAPIRALYRWADDHMKSRLSAEIQWGRGTRVQAKFLVQMAEFKALTEAIGKTSDQERTEMEANGTLWGADADKRTFHFETDTGQSIRGNAGLPLDVAHPVVLPKRYKATFVRVRVILYSTEEERDQFELVNLEII